MQQPGPTPPYPPRIPVPPHPPGPPPPRHPASFGTPPPAFATWAPGAVHLRSSYPEQQRDGKAAKRPAVETDSWGDPHMARVRRRDLRRLARGPQVFDTFPPHGAKGDERFPSPRRLRTVVAFGIDLVFHAAVAGGVWYAVHRIPTSSRYAIPLAVGAFVAVSLIHRTLLQAAFQATLGKALCGLRVIRQDNAKAPGVWYLIKKWLLPPVTAIVFAFNILASFN